MKFPKESTSIDKKMKWLRRTLRAADVYESFIVLSRLMVSSYEDGEIRDVLDLFDEIQKMGVPEGQDSKEFHDQVRFMKDLLDAVVGFRGQCKLLEKRSIELFSDAETISALTHSLSGKAAKAG